MISGGTGVVVKFMTNQYSENLKREKRSLQLPNSITIVDSASSTGAGSVRTCGLEIESNF